MGQTSHFELTPDKYTIKGVHRQTLWRRFLNWVFRRKSGTLWRTHIFDEPLTIRNGDQLNLTYKVTTETPETD